MKNILLTILGLIPIILMAQNPFTDVFPLVEGKVNYTEVIQVNGKSSSELYKNAKIWLVDAFKSSKDVIQNDDKDNHIIIGKGLFECIGHNKNISNAKYWFTIRIDCREGRYKYSITDFIYEFDVIVFGTKSHFKEDFTTWGNVPYGAKFKELLDKKYPPNKERNEKKQKEYEKYRAELDAEFIEKYNETVARYIMVDDQIKLLINTLKKSMNSTEEDW